MWSELLVACAALACLCAGLLAAAAVWAWLGRARTSIPGPAPLPLLGNALLFYRLPVLWDRFGELHRRYGDIFRFYVGPKLAIVLTQPEDVQSAMLHCKLQERDPYFCHVLRSFMGDGLITNKGETWKRHRKGIEPAFHIVELEKFMEKFNNAGRFLCDQLSEKKGTEVDLYRPLLMTTLSAAVETVFDFKLEYIFRDRNQAAEFVNMVADFEVALRTIFYRPWTTINFIRRMTAEGRTLIRYATSSKCFVERGIALCTKFHNGLKPSERSLLTFFNKQGTLMSTFTDEEAQLTATTVLTAAIETTSASMGYILTLLGLYPEWQDRAQRELDGYYGTGGDYMRSVTTADIPQLQVIDAIVKESGRLFTTLPLVPYLATEDVSLGGGRYVAPRGSIVLIAYYLMHRHPKLFPEPDLFDPGRFLEGGSAQSRKPYSYSPFGVGSRKCIGARYATLQMKVILATILRRYRVLPGSTREELEQSAVSITSHPITGFRVTFVPRDNIPRNPFCVKLIQGVSV